MTQRSTLPDRIGRYEVRGSVGGGGMGDVYRVYDPTARREIALKVLKFDYPRALHYFKREFRAVARLSHPNLVDLHDLHQVAGQYFYTMELIEGEDLYVYVNGHNHVITDPAQLSEPGRIRRVRHAFIQLLRALAYLHGQGCIHRDIKPSNILVDTAACVKLVDFGIVKQMLPGGEGQSLSQVFGTATYFSPEQSLGSRVTTATDLYAAGVVLYELLAGVPPFEGEGPEVAVMHRTKAPPSLAQRVPSIPADLALVCMELLSKDPIERPSAREALEMLDAPLSDQEAIPFEFVGRRAARKSLHLALESARQGQGRVVFIEGPGGAGKSALVTAFSQDARLFGASTFSGACVHRDHVPLRGLDTVVERLAEAYRKQTARILRRMPAARRAPLIEAFSFLGELVPASMHSGPSILPSGIGLHDLLSELGKHRLLIVVVEHIHLAEKATFDVLEALQTGGQMPPVLVVCTLRPDGVAPNSAGAEFLELARTWPQTSTIELGDFRIDETRRLLEEHLDEAPAWLVEHVQAETGGVPLFVTEMARDLQRNPHAMAPTFEEMVKRRIRGLSTDAQRLLAAVCLSPRAVFGRTLERSCGLDGDGLYEALSKLESAELTRAETTSDGQVTVVPVHPRLMEVARRGIDETKRRAMHEMLARASQASDGRVDTIEYHWAEAGRPERALRFAHRAAADAREAGQHARAVELLRLVLRNTPEPEARYGYLVHLADSLAESGHYLDAARTYDTLRQDYPGKESQFKATSCRLYLMAGDLAAFARNVEGLPSAARASLSDLLAPLAPEAAERLLGDTEGPQADLARARLLAGRNERAAISAAAELVQRHMEEAARPEPTRQAGFAIADAIVLSAQGRLADADEVIQAASKHLHSSLPARDLAALRLQFGAATVALARGQIARARAGARILLAKARQQHLIGLQARASELLARTYLEAGEYNAASHLIDEAARLWPAKPVALPNLQIALTRIRGQLYIGGVQAAQGALRKLKRDESLRALVRRRDAVREITLLEARMVAISALESWRAGDRARAQQGLETLQAGWGAIEKLLPRPDAWLVFFAAVCELMAWQPKKVIARLTQYLGGKRAPDDPQLQALLHFGLAAAEMASGLGDASLKTAERLLQEVGAARPPEAAALGI